MSDDPFEYVTPPLKIVRDMVAIPRARYEALLAEHHAIQRYLAGDTSCNGGAEIMFEKVYEQARAAGIPEAPQ